MAEDCADAAGDQVGVALEIGKGREARTREVEGGAVYNLQEKVERNLVPPGHSPDRSHQVIGRRTAK
ncbi:MAG TPA: hypothetical protein VFB34_04875 [Chloroflexota bacterium]|nr:hypothetical protein [Chloroflexota bacterium]